MGKIFFITNYSNKIGYGHLRRCLNIAEYISKNKKIYFVNTIKNSKGIKIPYLLKSINSLSKNVQTLSDVFVIDLIEKEFKKKAIQNIFKFSKKNTLFVIDNLFNFNYSAKYKIFPYIPSLSNKKIKHSGENYYIFDKKIIKISKQKISKKNQIIITMGGADPFGITIKLLKKIQKTISINFELLVIIGPLFSKENCKKIYNLSKKLKFKTLFNPKNYYKIIKESKLAIINSGNIKYECAFLGTPFLLVSNKKSEINNCLKFSKKFMTLNSKFNLNDINFNKIFRINLNKTKLLDKIANKNKKNFSKDFNKTINIIVNETKKKK
jgi:UDP-2,4-diacetamido-2,4,6-trideoxy-beta-L-altropyranose hydrolase